MAWRSRSRSGRFHGRYARRNGTGWSIWDRLTQGQALALTVLVDGGPAYDATRAAGVSKSSVHPWMKLPHFREAFRLLREERRPPYLKIEKLLDDPATVQRICIRASEDLRDMMRPPDHEAPWRGIDRKAARPVMVIVP